MNQPTVSILMATYNGAHFLQEQLSSIQAQTHASWKLYVSDDGSTDETVEIIRRFQAQMKQNQVILLNGPQQGFAANFLHLILHSDLSSNYFAFADQDDIWQPEKLARALAVLNKISVKRPALYGSRTELVDQHANHLGYSILPQRSPHFKNALAQNIAGGNTMVFNKALASLVKEIGSVEIASHDWWLYLIIMSIDGFFYFDEVSKIRYRQHAQNVVGSNRSVRGMVMRVCAMLQGRYRIWMAMNLKALEHIESLMTEENRKIFQMFVAARQASFFKRLPLLVRSDIRRQSFLGNCGFFIAAVLRRL